jgi:hypothetical protein
MAGAARRARPLRAVLAFPAVHAYAEAAFEGAVAAREAAANVGADGRWQLARAAPPALRAHADAPRARAVRTAVSGAGQPLARLALPTGPAAAASVGAAVAVGGAVAGARRERAVRRAPLRLAHALVVARAPAVP